MTVRKLRVGTRGSRLAMEQTRLVAEFLSRSNDGLEIRVVPVKTTGDNLPQAQRGETDGKGLFTADIETLLLKGELDMAVHSLKDMSVNINPSLVVAATPARGDPRDALVSAGGGRLESLPAGAVLGTSSTRRKAQLVALRSDLRLVDLHGNVETRIGKVAEGLMDGAVLAAAGLDRLGLGGRAAQRFTVDQVVPAAGQGTLAVETRRGDADVVEVVSGINDQRTMAESECERAFARAVGADCNLPVGAFAYSGAGSMTLTGMIASADGVSLLKRSATSTDVAGLGGALAKEMLSLGGAAILAGGASRL